MELFAINFSHKSVSNIMDYRITKISFCFIHASFCCIMNMLNINFVKLRVLFYNKKRISIIFLYQEEGLNSRNQFNLCLWYILIQIEASFIDRSSSPCKNFTQQCSLQCNPINSRKSKKCICCIAYLIPPQ